jgi:hypothetical protein
MDLEQAVSYALDRGTADTGGATDHASGAAPDGA